MATIQRVHLQTSDIKIDVLQILKAFSVKQVRTNIGLADTLIPSSFLYLIYMGGTGPCELMTIIFRSY